MHREKIWCSVICIIAVSLPLRGKMAFCDNNWLFLFVVHVKWFINLVIMVKVKEH